jgi:hypothetical protein
MTSQQLFWNVVIGVFLILVGAVLNPLLNQLWRWANRPRPLSPEAKAMLVQQIAQQEDALKQLLHYESHPKDLFLFLIQLLMVQVLALCVAICGRILAPSVLLVQLIFPVMAGTLALIGIGVAMSYSDKNIEKNKAKMLRFIEDAQNKINAQNRDTESSAKNGSV